MPLLEADGGLAPDPWQPVVEGGALPEGPALLSLERLLREGESLAGRNAPLGVELPPEANPAVLAPYLPRLALVVVRFGKFRDGRGFTQARALREALGFKGEIRAAGHVLPDQYRFLQRLGVTQVLLPEGADPAPWRHAAGLLRMAYQHAAGDAALSGWRAR